MKYLDTSAVSSINEMELKNGSIIHLQSAYKEALAALAQSIIGGSTFNLGKAYILYGCVNNGIFPAYNITSGAIFFNDEIYLVDAVNFSVTNPKVAVGIITTTYFTAINADAVDFSDGISRNVHQIRKIVFQEALSGSGASDFSNCIDLKYKLQGAIGELKMWKIPSGTISDYFDNSGLGTHSYTLGWALANGNNGTDNWSGLFPVAYKSGDSDFGTVGHTGGEKTHQLTQAELPNVDLHLKGGLPNNLTGVQSAGGANNGLQAPADRGELLISLGGSDTPHNNLPPFRVSLFVQRIS